MGERASAEIPATFSSSSILHACALCSGLRGRSRRSGRREAPPRRSLHSSMVLLTSLLEQKQRPEGSNTPSDLHDPHFCSHGNQSQPPGHTFCRDPKLKAHSRPGQLVLMMFRWSWSFLPVCCILCRCFLPPLSNRTLFCFPFQHAGFDAGHCFLRAPRLRIRVLPSSLRVLRGGSHREVCLQRPAEYPGWDPGIHEESVYNGESDQPDRSGVFQRVGECYQPISEQ